MPIKALSTRALPLRQWPAPGHWTYEDYLAIPDDGMRYEIIEGHLFMMSPGPSSQHQWISRNICWILEKQVRERDLGVVLDALLDVVMGTKATPVQPDVLFVRKDHRSIIEDQVIRGAPDLLVEILLRSTKSHDRERKFRLYEACGVNEYWIIDPIEKTFDVYVLTKRRTLRESGHMAP